MAGNPYLDARLDSCYCDTIPSNVWDWSIDNFLVIRFGSFHDDVIKREHFPRYWPLRRRIHRSPVDSHQKCWWVFFHDFFDLRLHKRLNKQSRRRSFETPSRSLWRHCYVASRFLLLFLPLNTHKTRTHFEIRHVVEIIGSDCAKAQTKLPKWRFMSCFGTVQVASHTARTNIFLTNIYVVMPQQVASYDVIFPNTCFVQGTLIIVHL